MRPPEMYWHSPDKCNAWIKDHMPGNKEPSGGFLEFNPNEVEPA